MGLIVCRETTKKRPLDLKNDKFLTISHKKRNHNFFLERVILCHLGSTVAVNWPNFQPLAVKAIIPLSTFKKMEGFLLNLTRFA